MHPEIDQTVYRSHIPQWVVIQAPFSPKSIASLTVVASGTNSLSEVRHVSAFVQIQNILLQKFHGDMINSSSKKQILAGNLL